MAATTKADTVVIVDDEPHNVLWMVDYLESKGLKTISCVDANDAMRVIRTEIFRALVVDLSIPVFEPFKSRLSEAGELYQRYPGLIVAKEARNIGYRGRQVIIYSVHREDSIQGEADRLMCTYITKGRPRMIKEELDAVVSYDPTEQD